MKDCLLVQQREAEIPAPVWEVVARAAAASLPPRLSVVLHGKLDCELSCFAPKVLSETLLTTVVENLPFSAPMLSACTQKDKNKIMLPKEHNLVSMKSSSDLSA